MWDSIKEFFSDVLSAIGNLFKDMFLYIFELFVDLLIFIVSLIPVPNELLANTASSLLHPDIGYFLGVTGFGNCLAVLASGLIFRIVRRFVTLGIW